jgi:phenylalanyl-tRNA synthetase beta chain
MQVPIGWLREFIRHDYDRESLERTLTSIGLEAEPFSPEPLGFAGVFIGRIVKRENAPDGRGFVYTVEVGGAFPGGKVTVFSTIPDLREGVKYPVALPGGHVGDLEISERPYEGFTSRGKFCCSTELELTKLEFVEYDDGTVAWKDGLEDADGRALSIFPDCGDLETGTDLAAWLHDDPVVTIELTSNRADCHSMLGVAREMRVVTSHDITIPALYSDFEETSGEAEDISIRIDDPKGCTRYAGLVIDKIRMAPSPLWMAKKLFSVGMRPISNLVDITNLVLYEFGQPLHAFDHALLKNATIIVRRASEGETMPTIDGIIRNLIPADLVIADAEDPVAIAGVMGGFASEVTGNTRRVLLESAWFDPISIRRTSRRLALRTDAAIRFERGVDPNGIVRAVHRVAHLVRELKCGVPARKIAVAKAGEEKEIVIRLEESHVGGLLGDEIPTGRIESILEGLGFMVDGVAPSWEIHVPSFRRDIFIAEDLIEEIARHVGYDNLRAELPRPHMRAGLVDEDIRLRREMKGILAGLGLWELNSFPLCTESGIAKWNSLIPDAKPATLLNPITEDAVALRISLVPGVVDTYIRNLKRGSPIYDVFEIGRVYWRDETDFHERHQVIIGCLGDKAGKKSERNRERAFLRLKGYVEALLGELDVFGYDIVSDDSAPKGYLRYLLNADGKTVGVFESVLEEAIGGETFERPVFTATFTWQWLKSCYIGSREKREFHPMPAYPAVDRDLAFVVDEPVAYRRMYDAIREAGSQWLQKVEVFDVYRGKQVGEGKKNIAVALRFRNPERTLTDEEVDGWMSEIASLVKERTGGSIRDW